MLLPNETMNHLARSLAIILADYPRLAGLIVRILNHIDRKKS